MFEQVETFGKYALMERLAVGGMAEIFRARMRGVSGADRFVAIKRIHRHLEQDENLVHMLVDEARLTVRLQHPNVGQVFDIGCIDGQHFLVMEFISGVDLHRVLRRIQEKQRHIPTAMVLYTMIEMLAGLHYAHEMRGDDGELLNVVHRDISPQNIMFSMDGDVKLIDFGIAKARSQVMQTQVGIIKGKFYYMSPEQAHGQKLDQRCDVFAAGMVMYELLTGRAAYDELGDVALLRKVRACDFEPPSHWRRDLDPNLEVIILKALKKDLRQRFQSAQEFRAALQHYAKHHFPPLTRTEASAFVTRLLEPEQVKQRTARAVDLMRRDDFSATEDSLIFDASHLARSMEAPAVDRNFADQLAPDENPFATADEPTYVYSKEDENPFAIPDEITSPVQRAAPNRRRKKVEPARKAPAVRKAPAARKMPTARKTPAAHKMPPARAALPPRSAPKTPPAKKIKIGPPPSPPTPMRMTGEGLAYMEGEITDPVIVDDVTIPRLGVDRRAIDMPDSYEPEHNPNYVVPISLDPPPGSLGPREITQITKPKVSALQYGFRSTEEADAVDRAQVMASAPQAAASPAREEKPAGALAPLLQLKASFDASPHRSKILIIAACVLAFGILFPFLIPGTKEPVSDDVVAMTPLELDDDPITEPDAPRFATLQITTRPSGADVLLNGKFVGTTPKVLNTLRVKDSPKLTLRVEGFEIWEEDVLIDRAAPDPLSVTLKPSMRDGVIFVETTPPGLVVRLDDKVVGKTPYTAHDIDRKRNHVVIVTRGEDLSKGKRSLISWGDGEPIQKTVSFDFGSAQGDSALPGPPDTNKVVAQKIPSRKKTPRKRTVKRNTRKKPPSDKNTSPPDASINVWGGGGQASASDPKDDSIDVWGNKSKSKDSGGDGPGYLTVKVRNGDGMIYVDGKLVKKSEPLTKHSLSPGKHKVYVRYTMLKRNSKPRTVNIKSGQSKTITFRP